MSVILREKRLKKLYEKAGESESRSDGNYIDCRGTETTPFRPSFGYHRPKKRVTGELLEFIGGWKRLEGRYDGARVDKTTFARVYPSDTLIEDTLETIWFISQT